LRLPRLQQQRISGRLLSVHSRLPNAAEKKGSVFRRISGEAKKVSPVLSDCGACEPDPMG
jgi:hypothetical protein